MEYTRYTNSVSMFYMDVDSEFVKAISAEISKRNLGLREAAQVIGTSHPTLGRVLAGDKVSFEFACQVAPFLRLPKEASVRLAGLLPPVPESTARLGSASPHIKDKDSCGAAPPRTRQWLQ